MQRRTISLQIFSSYFRRPHSILRLPTVASSSTQYTALSRLKSLTPHQRLLLLYLLLPTLIFLHRVCLHPANQRLRHRERERQFRPRDHQLVRTPFPKSAESLFFDYPASKLHARLIREVLFSRLDTRLENIEGIRDHDAQTRAERASHQVLVEASRSVVLQLKQLVFHERNATEYRETSRCISLHGHGGATVGVQETAVIHRAQRLVTRLGVRLQRDFQGIHRQQHHLAAPHDRASDSVVPRPILVAQHPRLIEKEFDLVLAGELICSLQHLVSRAETDAWIQRVYRRPDTSVFVVLALEENLVPVWLLVT